MKKTNLKPENYNWNFTMGLVHGVFFAVWWIAGRWLWLFDFVCDFVRFYCKLASPFFFFVRLLQN